MVEVMQEVHSYNSKGRLFNGATGDVRHWRLATPDPVLLECKLTFRTVIKLPSSHIFLPPGQS